MIKRFLIWLITMIIETILSFIFENKLKEIFMFIRNHFPEFILIILISTTVIFFIILFLIHTINSISLLKAKSKYYDIMITKFYDHIKNREAAIIGVTKTDLKLFSKSEKKALKKHFKDLEKLKIEMKGTNQVFNMFGKYD